LRDEVVSVCLILAQSLKDPLRAKGFMGTVTKGEAEVGINAADAA